jgi:hypothetical protein
MTLEGAVEHMATKKSAKSEKEKALAKKKKAGKVSKPAAEKTPEIKIEETPSEKRSKSALVNKLLDAAERKVTADDVKASIGDVIRLLQLQKELEQEEPREITVQWIERAEKRHAREK